MTPRVSLRMFAENIILDANTVESVLENNPRMQTMEATNALDPESWRVARFYARKIAAAIDGESEVNPDWFDRIQAALST